MNASVVDAVRDHIIEQMLLIAEGHILRGDAVHFAKDVLASHLSCGRGALNGGGGDGVAIGVNGILHTVHAGLDLSLPPIHLRAEQIDSGEIEILIIRHDGTGAGDLRIERILQHQVSAR